MDPDKRLFELWNKMDSHPDKKRSVTFYFYFPNQKNAKLASGVLRREGFETDIHESSKPDSWDCIAYKEMVPEYVEIHDLRNWLEKIATDLNGEYDGWETQVFPGEFI